MVEQQRGEGRRWWGVEEKDQGGWETETKMETGGRVEDTGGNDGGTGPKERKGC